MPKRSPLDSKYPNLTFTELIESCKDSELTLSEFYKKYKYLDLAGSEYFKIVRNSDLTFSEFDEKCKGSGLAIRSKGSGRSFPGYAKKPKDSHLTSSKPTKKPEDSHLTSSKPVNKIKDSGIPLFDLDKMSKYSIPAISEIISDDSSLTSSKFVNKIKDSDLTLPEFYQKYQYVLTIISDITEMSHNSDLTSSEFSQKWIDSGLPIKKPSTLDNHIKERDNKHYGSAGSPISDLRFKKNVIELKNSLSKVLSLQGVSYEWRQDEFKEIDFSNKPGIGFIAQEAEKIVPEFVETSNDGYKRIHYANMIPLLVEALKEQQKQIDELKSQITENQMEYGNL